MSEHLDVQLAHQLLTGELADQTCARWMEHVRTCPRCQTLLANERTLLAILELGCDDATPGKDADLDRVLDQVDRAGPGAGVRHRRMAVQMIAAGIAVIGLAVLLAFQLASGPPTAETIAEELRVSVALQGRVVARLDTLDTLAKDPWLIDHYEAVRTLEQLIYGKQAP